MMMAMAIISKEIQTPTIRTIKVLSHTTTTMAAMRSKATAINKAEMDITMSRECQVLISETSLSDQ